MTTLKAAYSVSELATMAGLSRHQMYRLLRKNGVGTRDELVPIVALRDAMPEIWDSILLVQQRPVICDRCGAILTRGGCS